jgi:transposase
MTVDNRSFWVYASQEIWDYSMLSECAMERPTGLPISDEDWHQTPQAVQAVVTLLVQRVTVLQGQVEALQAEVGRLREQLGRDSQNSSKPPSSDGPRARPRPQRQSSGRKAGGQPGHVGHGRKLKPLDQVTRVIEVKAVSCGKCGALLLGEDVEPVRHQVTELPRIEPEVIEYRQHTLTCLACGAKTSAEQPVDMPAGSFGPRAQATVGYLSGRFGISQRDVEELLGTVFHTEIGLGSVPAQQEQVSAALAEPVQAAHEYAQEQLAKNVDETSWREGTKRAWLWIEATSLVTVFLVLATRGAKSARQILGDVVQGVVGSDRWSAYNWLDPRQRQLCWAHLKRDFQALVERGGEAERIGQALLDQVEQMFSLWHRVRDGTLSRPDFQAAMQPIQQRVGELLREGTQLTCDKTRRTCENILKLEVALWTFVYVAGVEPTNNDAERPLRRAVLWRRRSFGTQSPDGSRFVERILTTVTTLRQQKRDVLDYLTEACAAAIRGDKAPSLLPESSVVTQ